MAIKLPDGSYKCSYCNKVYKDQVKADSCRENHNLVYVQLSVGELNSLMAFIYTKNEENLMPSTVMRLKKALRNAQKREG